MFESLQSSSLTHLSRDEFNDKINKWSENEIQLDPDNRENIIKARDAICESHNQSSIFLSLRGLGLKSLPIEMANLSTLEQLDLSDNQLTILPDVIPNLKKLTVLSLSNNQIEVLSEKIGDLLLKQLDLSKNKITELPQEIGNLSSLFYLDLSENQITNLTSSIGNLQELAILNLSKNQLRELPEEIGNLGLLEELHLSENQIISLPSSIGNLQELTMVDLSKNQLTELIEPIFALRNLTTLFLNENQIVTLPAQISDLQNLNYLNISNNQLTAIPEQIANLENLNHLDLSSNPFEDLPDAVREMQNSIFIDYTDTPYWRRINLELRVINSDNQQSPQQRFQQAFSPLELINLLSENACFTESDKMQDFKNFLSLHQKIQIQTSRANQDSELSQSTLSEVQESHYEILGSRLGAILEFFHNYSKSDFGSLQRDQDRLENNSQAGNQNVFSKLITSFNRFLIESSSWNHQSSQTGDDLQQRRLILSRQLLSILSEIYERRTDNDFLKSVEQIINDSLEDCRDRNSLLIYNLVNFCQRKNVDELESMMVEQPLKLFDYFKNQLLYNYFLNLGQERVDEIINGIQGYTNPNPNFTEDVEVLLNYLRIYNINFGDKLDLNLPNINSQSYYTIPYYQPSNQQIREFEEIANQYQAGNLLPLCNHLASIISSNFDKSLPITNPEILELTFVKNRNQKIIEIAGEFMEIFTEYATQNQDQITNHDYFLKNNQIKNFKDQLTQDEFLKIFENSLSQLASNQQPTTEFRADEIKAIEEKFINFFRDRLGIEVEKKSNEEGKISWQLKSSVTRSVATRISDSIQSRNNSCQIS